MDFGGDSGSFEQVNKTYRFSISCRRSVEMKLTTDFISARTSGSFEMMRLLSSPVGLSTEDLPCLQREAAGWNCLRALFVLRIR
jgi:hypothetical protein